jgi:hypothetical protein
MRRRLSLETLESRVTPAALGTLWFDTQHLAVSFAAVAPASPGSTPPPTGSGHSATPSGTIVLPPVAAGSATGVFAVLGSLSGTDTADSYTIPNAVQGTSLTVSLGGTGQMSLTVLGQNGIVLATQTAQGTITLTVTNLPLTGGVTVVVTGASPTTYLLSTTLTASSTSSASSLGTTAPPAGSQPVAPVLSGGLGPQLIDPDGLADPQPVTPVAIDPILWDWGPLGSIQLYDPTGRTISSWVPYPTVVAPPVAPPPMVP